MRGIEELKEKLSQGELEAWAAVAVLLRERDEAIEVLLVKRAVVQGDPWSGDMAFPGGKRTPVDPSLKVTVYREVQEETGIDLDEVEFLGTMPVLFSALRNGMSVLPIIYRWRGDQRITLNHELDSYRWVDLRGLRDKRQVMKVKGWEGPVFNLGDEVVWGLTYRMLEALLELIS